MAVSKTLQRAHLRRARYAERQLVGGRLVHPGAPHGHAGGYQNWGCRCELCTTANVDARSRWRKDDPAWSEAARVRRSAAQSARGATNGPAPESADDQSRSDAPGRSQGDSGGAP